jgi:general secretion pathway protein I
MVSISILALVFLSLFRMQSSTIALAEASKFNTLAPMLARQLLVQIEQDLSTGPDEKGDFGEDFPGLEWTCHVLDAAFEPVDFMDETSQNRFKKIEIEIIDSVRSRSFRVQTWRFADE